MLSVVMPSVASVSFPRSNLSFQARFACSYRYNDDLISHTYVHDPVVLHILLV